MHNRSIHSAVAAVAVALAAAISLAAPAYAAGTVALSALTPASPLYELGPVIATGKCDLADAPARVSRAYPAEWPEVAAGQGIDAAQTTVLINLDSRGTLVNSAIAQSSGNMLLDDEALVVVRNSSYTPEIHECNRYARAYFIDVMFE
ncbi:MAG: TonB family protein [Candidatus Eremiobacteraeota bacterium]|nr:TonB family protein [Candidatus Eremiobacteraeota bacterium]